MRDGRRPSCARVSATAWRSRGDELGHEQRAAEDRRARRRAARPRRRSAARARSVCRTQRAGARAARRRRARRARCRTASHFETPRSTVPLRRCRQPPTRLRDRAVGEVGADRDDRVDARERGSSSGVMSEPPPMPVRPMRMPTPRPKSDDQRVHQADVQPALGLVGARPAAVAAAAGVRARRAADRRVALVVQRVVRQVALVDPLSRGPLGPVGERVVLRRSPRFSSPSTSSASARVGDLLAADAGDPGVGAGQRAARARRPSATPQQCSGPVHGRVPTPPRPRPSTPKRSSNARHVASVSGNSTPVSIVTTRASRRDAHAARRR